MPYSHFITYSNLHEIRHPKHIVVVCGITGDVATTDTDGWLLSDFFFLVHALHGGEATRTWLTCVPPDILMERYALFAAENGFDSRLPDCIRICDEGDLFDAWNGETERACEEAERGFYFGGRVEENVLIVVLGHGDLKIRGIEVGRDKNIQEPSPQDFLDIEETGQSVVSPYWLLKGEIVQAIAQDFPRLDVSLMVPEYFCGSWRYYPKAGFPDYNEWLCFDRIEGTVFSQEIASISSEVEYLADENEEQFDPMVRAILLDRFVEGDITQRDGADSGRSSAAQLLESCKMPTHGKEQIPVPQPDPVSEARNDIEYLPLVSSLVDRVGGSQSSMHRLLRKQAKALLQTWPGLMLHRYSKDIRESIKKCLLEFPTESEFETLTTFLHYRFTISAITWKLLHVMDLDRYQLHDFNSWDLNRWLSRHGLPPANLRKLFDESWTFQALSSIFDSDLMILIKPTGYIMAACIRGGLTDEEILKRLQHADDYMKIEKRRTERYALEKLKKKTSLADKYIKHLDAQHEGKKPRASGADDDKQIDEACDATETSLQDTRANESFEPTETGIPRSSNKSIDEGHGAVEPNLQDQLVVEPSEQIKSGIICPGDEHTDEGYRAMLAHLQILQAASPPEAPPVVLALKAPTERVVDKPIPPDPLPTTLSERASHSTDSLGGGGSSLAGSHRRDKGAGPTEVYD